MLTVRSRVSLDVTPTFTSTPMAAGSCPAVVAPPSSTLPTTNGFTFRFLPCRMPSIPSSVPAMEASKIRKGRGAGDHCTHSLRRRMIRWMLKPHLCTFSLSSKRSVLNGIANSAVHPQSCTSAATS